MSSETGVRRRAPGRWVVRLHRWLGLGLGILVLVSAVSGVGLAWRDHVWRLQHPSLAASVPRLTNAQMAARIETILSRHGAAEVRLLAPPKENLAGWRVWLENGEQALYSADAERPLARWDESRSLFGLMLELHVDLFAGTPGRWLMGAVGLGSLVLTVLGIWGWLAAPRRLQARHLAPASLRRGPWLLAHRQWGLLVAVPTLLLMLTGTLMNWSTLWRSALPPPVAAIPAERSSATADEVSPRSRSPAAEPTLAPPNLARAIGSLRRQWPDARLAFINVADIEAGRVSGRLRQPGEVHPNGRSSVTVSTTGEVLERYDALQAGALGKLDDLVYPLHSGRIAIPGWHLGVVLSGLVLAGLGVTGFATWLAGRRRRHPAPGRHQPVRPTRPSPAGRCEGRGA